MVGLGEPFWEHYWPKLAKTFPQLPQEKSPSFKEFHRLVNKCQPGLIRVEADEVTYPMHVIVRYEIERDLFDGRISVAEIPRVWREKVVSLRSYVVVAFIILFGAH